MQPVATIAASSHHAPVTALQLAGRILAAAGGSSGPTSSTDRIVAGDPATPITGIATVAMASVAALKKAADKRCNFVISYDPIFWSDGDRLEHIEGNRLLEQKRGFIRDHDLVVLDLHDGWAAGIDAGMARTLGWEGYRIAPDQPLYKMPEPTLLSLARALHARLDDRTMRIVGNPALLVSSVAASWGNARQLPTIAQLNGPADVVVCGYSHEWEAVEYAQDLIAAGAKKGMILLGEAKSVDGGMRHCAEWLRTIISEIPIEFIPATEPYWTPQHPVTPTRI